MTYLPGMKDGDDVAEGATTDIAVTGDVPGTLSAKARGLSKIWADVWDQVNHRINVGSTIINASLRSTSLDGDNATLGTTTDAVTALTLVGLLKAIKAALSGTLATRALSSGTDSVTISGTVTVTDSVALPVVLPAATVTALTPPTSVGVNNFPATQPVSAAALPLPAGAATEAGHLSTIDGKVPSLGQAVAAASVPVVLPAAQITALTPLASVGVTNFPATQPVSATALPLPAGAALEAGHLATIDTKTPTLGQALAAASAPVVLPAAQVTALTPLASVGVNNFPATQPISAASLPLPAGAATDGADSSDAQATQATAGVGIRGWLSTLVSLFRAGTAKVTLQGTSVVSGTITANAGTGTMAVSNVALPLPAGASTETTLAAVNTKLGAALPLPAGAATEAGHLATIDTNTGRLPAQGQALAAASVPVVLPAAQITALTPPSAVGVNNFPATQPVSATALPLPAGAAQDGTDSSDPGATQATAGGGIRGWLSTLVSLFRAGTARVTLQSSATLYDGTVSVTTVAAAIAPSQSCATLILQADPANTVTILVGNGTGQHFALMARDSLQLSVSNIALVYAKTTTGTAVLNYLARS